MAAPECSVLAGIPARLARGSAEVTGTEPDWPVRAGVPAARLRGYADAAGTAVAEAISRPEPR